MEVLEVLRELEDPGVFYVACAGLLSVLMTLALGVWALLGRRASAPLWFLGPMLTMLLSVVLSWLSLQDAWAALEATPLEGRDSLIFSAYWKARAPSLVAFMTMAICASLTSLFVGVGALRRKEAEVAWTWTPTFVTGLLTLLGAFGLGLWVVEIQQSAMLIPGILVVVGLGCALSGARAVGSDQRAAGARLLAWFSGVVAMMGGTLTLVWSNWLVVSWRLPTLFPADRAEAVAEAWVGIGQMRAVGGGGAVLVVLTLGLPTLWVARRLGSSRAMLASVAVVGMTLLSTGSYALVLTRFFELASVLQDGSVVGDLVTEGAAEVSAPVLLNGRPAAPAGSYRAPCYLRWSQERWDVFQGAGEKPCPLKEGGAPWPLPEEAVPGLVVPASMKASVLAQIPWYSSGGALGLVLRRAPGEPAFGSAPWFVRQSSYSQLPLWWVGDQSAEPSSVLGCIVDGPQGAWWVTRKDATLLGQGEEAAKAMTRALSGMSANVGARHDGTLVLVAGEGWTVQDLSSLCLQGLRSAGGAARRCALVKESAQSWLARHQVSLSPPEP